MQNVIKFQKQSGLIDFRVNLIIYLLELACWTGAVGEMSQYVCSTL